MRRGRLLLFFGVVALMLVPHAAADPTATTPAPDPNPPPGAAPDPYTPPAKSSPARSTPTVHVAPPVYSAPSRVTPVYTAPRASTPRPTRIVVHRSAPKPKRRVRAVHHRRKVVHHKARPLVVRFTPRLDSYITTVVKTMGVAVVSSDASSMHRRRVAALALVALCVASFGLILLARRQVSERPS